jgi:hypothetical protein
MHGIAVFAITLYTCVFFYAWGYKDGVQAERDSQ